MIKKFTQLTFIQLTALCCAFVLVFHTARGTADFLKEKSRRDAGQLKTLHFSETDFEHVSLLPAENGEYIATDGDPQMIITVDGLFTGIKMHMEAAMPPGKIIAFYTTGRDMPFSEKQILWLYPVKDRDNIYSAAMPPEYIHTLRIDPTELGANRLKFGRFEINSKNTPTDYLKINHINMPYMAVYTAVLASVLKLLQEILQKININSIKKK